jgi:oxygen-independent coproporphyrinogen-3 oxidase
VLSPRHVYVHVPFCARRCSYCDFSIAVRRDVPVDEYLAALEAELSVRFPTVQGEVDTIYLGGGTPSQLGGDGVRRALNLVRARFPAADGAEITIEANPDDLSVDAARAWVNAGVTRLSLGSQSFNDLALQWMHRSHDAAAIGRAVQAARDGGLGNLSLDLIFALPAALNRDFESDVHKLLALQPDHVSLYGLTVEPGTPLGGWVARGKAVEQPEEGYEADFMLAHQLLTAAGFEHYEVSNYALPGRRARHNAAYWAAVPYVGLGPSAHGFDGEVRRWNTRTYSDWCDRATEHRDPIGGDERLTAENRIAESVYLGLRSDTGLALEPGEQAMVAPWMGAGWTTVTGDGEESGRLRCTASGWLRLDSLAASLTHHRSR